MNTQEKQLGFHNRDGSLEEFIEWGFDISFKYNDRVYKFEWYEDGEICRRCVEDRSPDTLYDPPIIIAEDDDIEKLLATPFLGETLRDIIDKSEIVGYA